MSLSRKISLMCFGLILITGLGTGFVAFRSRTQALVQHRQDQVAHAASDDWAVLEISDTGPGMSEAVRSRIFDPFFTTKEVGKGTGQGLAIAHSVVVDKHAGTIEVESEVGRGTTFRIRLPLGGSRGEDQDG